MILIFKLINLLLIVKNIIIIQFEITIQYTKGFEIYLNILMQ